VTLMLLVQLLLLVGDLWFQYHNYATGIALAERAGAAADTVSLILVYSRAWDFAVTKTSALFLGFMVIYTGALYVLRSADTAYELSVGQGTQLGASLKSSSPGLMLVTIGALLVALVLHSRSEVGFQVSAGSGLGDGATATLSATTSSTTSSTAAVTIPAAPAAAPATPATTPATPATTAPVRAPAAPAVPAPAEDRRMPKLLDPK